MRWMVLAICWWCGVAAARPLPDPVGRAGLHPIPLAALKWYCHGVEGSCEVLIEEMREMVSGDGENQWRRAWSLYTVLVEDGVELTPDATLERMRDSRFAGVVGEIFPDAEPDENALEQASHLGEWQLRLGVMDWGYRFCADRPHCSDEAAEVFYRENPGLFLVPEHRSLTLLVIDRKRPDAEECRREIAAQLLQGLPFARVAEAVAGGDEKLRLEALRSPEVRQAMQGLPAGEPNRVSEMVTTPELYVWGQAKVYKEHFIPFDADLRLRLRGQLIEREASLRLGEKVAERRDLFAADFEWYF